jgi:hypothetical protein
MLRDGGTALRAESSKGFERRTNMLELFQPAEGQTVTESNLIMRFSSDQVWIMDRMTARWAVFDRQGMLRGCSTPITVGILQHLEQAAFQAFEGSSCQH